MKYLISLKTPESEPLMLLHGARGKLCQTKEEAKIFETPIYNYTESLEVEQALADSLFNESGEIPNTPETWKALRIKMTENGLRRGV